MNPGERLLKHLTKQYEPSRMVSSRFGRYDAATKTDEEGDPVLVFISKVDERGILKGDKFTRRLLKDANGAVIKNYWDHKSGWMISPLLNLTPQGTVY